MPLGAVECSRGQRRPGQNRDKSRWPFRGPSFPETANLLPLSLSTRRSAGRKKVRGCIYARFSTKFQQSIADQVRACQEWADRNDVTVLPHHIFTDEGVTAKRRRRVGLTAMIAAVEADEVDVVITFSTNRLHRKIHLALGFVEETILEKRRRCVFVAQNIDTQDTKFWKALVYVFAMLDEVGVQMSTAHIRQAHIGLLLKRVIHGTLTFGYTGTVVPGELTRRNRPRRRWEVDPAAAPWVPRIFEWFTRGSRKSGFKAIATRLRDAQMPPPPKVDRWTSKAVKYLLMNRRYVGDWSYGWKETVWQSKADYARQFPKEIPTHVHRMEELRLIPDAVFLAAQAKIEAQGGYGGRPSHKGTSTYPDVAAEVLWCPAHERHITVRGAGGSQLACPDCKAMDEGEQPLYSVINRKLARRLLFETLAGRVCGDEALVKQVIAAAVRQIETAQRPDDRRLQTLDRELKSLSEKSTFILQNPGLSDTDREENARELAKVRRQRASVEAQRAELQAAASIPTKAPSQEEIQEMLRGLSGILVRAADSEDAVVHAEALKVVVALTGGKVRLSQQGERRHHGGWLRGTFELQLIDAALKGAAFAASGEAGQQVVLDFRQPTQPELLADGAKALYEQGKLVKQIAAELGVSRNLAAAALDHWFTSRGMPKPDGRSRRSDLEVKHSVPPLYQQLAPKVGLLAESGMLLQDIAVEIHCDRNTVAQSLKFLRRRAGAPDESSGRDSLP